ncbi:MAG: hypothetical protein ACOC16_02105 [Nanoarchaeota archaeon]
MKVDNIDILSQFTNDFCEIVEKHCKYVVVSGFLAISSGRSRGTEDIDIIVSHLSLKEFEELHKDLLKKFSLLHLDELLVEDVYDYLKDSNIRYVYKGTIIPNMEFKFAKTLIDKDNLEKRKKINLTDLDIYFAPIECAIVFKEKYLGSEKDLEDARHLRNVYLEEIDEKEIDRYSFLIDKMLED